MLQYRHADQEGPAREFETAPRPNRAALWLGANMTYLSYLGLGHLAQWRRRDQVALDCFHWVPRQKVARSSASRGIMSLTWGSEDLKEGIVTASGREGDLWVSSKTVTRRTSSSRP